MKSDTYQQVFEAADRLLAEGVRPTQQAIRDQLGKGSLTTINKALGDWWRSLGERLSAGRRYPELPESLSSAMEQWWQQALDQSRSEFELQHDRLVRDKRALKQQHRDQLDELQAQLSRSLEKQTEQVDKQQQLNQQLEQMRQEQLELERRVLVAEQRAQQAEYDLKVQASVQSKLEQHSRKLEKQLNQQGAKGSAELLQENANLKSLVDELDQKYNQLLQLVENKR